MAPVLEKRSRVTKKSGSRKRQRADPDESVLEQLPEDEHTDSLTLNTLPWTAVSLPGGLDDAEGFLGLEEISDVELLRDANIGKIKCRIATPKPNKHNLNASKNEFKSLKFERNIIQVTEIEDGGEWEGFDISENGETVRPNHLTQKPKSSLKKTSRKPEPFMQDGIHLSEKENAFPGNAENRAGNSFELLENTVKDEVDVSAWQFLNLSPTTLSSIAALGFSKPTPIQALAIPEILNGYDVVGKAVTGSGKTLAFGIPILEYHTERRADNLHETSLTTKPRECPVALILSPTRELAHQLCTHLNSLCSSPSISGPSIATVTGGLSLHKQRRLLRNADIIIGTPGRLWEVIQGDHELAQWLKMLKFLIVDEADRLLSDGHFKEVEEILNALDRTDSDTDVLDSIHPTANLGAVHDGHDEEKNHRQTLVFSATFQRDLQQKLAGKGKSFGELMSKQESMEYLLKKLNFRGAKPKFIDVDPVSQMASRLKEGILECGGLEKDLYLYTLLLHHPNTRTLIFTNSITSVRRLTPFLQNLDIAAHALHSQMPQKARLRSVERFSSPKSPSSILIATDVAARGLDIPSVQLIIHYHVPRAADMYVHRSGRTARAASSGSSILLCAPEEVLGVRRLVAKVHARNVAIQSTDKNKYFIRTIEIDRRIVTRLKSRVALSKKISDSSLAKEKKGHEENWLHTAAEELGVNYDSEEFAAVNTSQRGRGQGKMKAEKEARSLTKDDVGALRAQLKHMLSQRVNVGVSERYLSAGGVDVDELLAGQGNSVFLGKIDQGSEIW